MKKWAYYNDREPYVCEWVRNLIRAGLIMDGEVDERDIRDVRPVDLQGFIQVHMFCGIAGWALALRRAAFPDDREVWTGSAPCQPFSAAGKRGGFADERHLWPYWYHLIAQRRPPTILGEQVASAADWLRLVRGDLEALDYAVGAIPVEAASAGADHLRDRYWFVAYAEGHGCEASKPAVHAGARYGVIANGSANNGVALGDADEPRSQGWTAVFERAGERTAGQTGVAYPNFFFPCDGGLQRSGQLGGAGGDQEACVGDVGHAFRARAGRDSRDGAGAQAPINREWQFNGRVGHAPVAPDSELEWVLGADGKARRVKPGIRLLAHGVPARVAKLRAFGNAIDPRPAAAFIKAALNLP